MSGVNTSVKMVLEGRNVEVYIEGLDTVEQALGDMKGKTPAAIKVAINSTARETRKRMITAAKAKYAVNAKGQSHLKDLKQTKKATNRSLNAQLFISKMRNDLAYFQHSPTTVYSGREVFEKAPVWVKAKVLKISNMTALTGSGNLSKGFLAKFQNGHIGMVQRVIGSKSSNTTTASGKKRWTNRSGNVEKLQTMGAPSASAMHTKAWYEVKEEMEEYLMVKLAQRVDQILEKAGQ